MERSLKQSEFTRRESTPATFTSNHRSSISFNENDDSNNSGSNSVAKPAIYINKRRTSMLNPIDPMELQKQLYQNQNFVNKTKTLCHLN
jgi:hypothetical protein